MFKDLTKEVPPIMNVLNIHENLLEVLLEMGNYADVQVSYIRNHIAIFPIELLKRQKMYQEI